MTPSDRFTTDRLCVFSFACVPPTADLAREVHVGWLRIEEQTYPVITATTGPFGLEMIETHDFYRRKGYARELLKALAARGHDVHGDGVSFEGACLMVGMGLGEDAREEQEQAALPIPPLAGGQ